jgi:hypothetical protein
MVFPTDLFQRGEARGRRLRLPVFQVVRPVHLLDPAFADENFPFH